MCIEDPKRAKRTTKDVGKLVTKRAQKLPALLNSLTSVLLSSSERVLGLLLCSFCAGVGGRKACLLQLETTGPEGLRESEHRSDHGLGGRRRLKRGDGCGERAGTTAGTVTSNSKKASPGTDRPATCAAEVAGGFSGRLCSSSCANFLAIYRLIQRPANPEPHTLFNTHNTFYPRAPCLMQGCKYFGQVAHRREKHIWVVAILIS